MHIKEYVTKTGKRPFKKWLDGIDRSLSFRIKARLSRISSTGNLGDVKVIKGPMESLRYD